MSIRAIAAVAAASVALVLLPATVVTAAGDAARPAVVVAKDNPKPKVKPKPQEAKKGAIPFKAPSRPAPIAYAPGQLTFAQFNVCKTLCAPPAPSWEERRSRVERVLASTSADVIGINEATNYAVTNAKTQWIDLQNMMLDDGYAATRTVVDECERPRDANGQLAGPSPCEHTTGILYKTATVKEITTPSGTPSSGATMVGKLGAGVTAETATREVNWGFLQASDGSTPPFLVISMHLTTLRSPEAEAGRVAAAQGLAGWVSAKIAEAGLPATTPVVLLADLNSHAKRQPNGAQKVLSDNGWVDAYVAAPKVINDRWSTVNETPERPSWDPRGPYFYYSRKNPVTRIDYIMTRGAKPIEYETMMFLNADGTPVLDYQGSDHNAIRTVVKF